LSFIMATRTGALCVEPQGLPPGLLFLDRLGLERNLARAAPANSGSAPISTLDDQRAVELWHREQSALGN
jgi:hypothetical protein